MASFEPASFQVSSPVSAAFFSSCLWALSRYTDTSSSPPTLTRCLDLLCQGLVERYNDTILRSDARHLTLLAPGLAQLPCFTCHVKILGFAAVAAAVSGALSHLPPHYPVSYDLLSSSPCLVGAEN